LNLAGRRRKPPSFFVSDVGEGLQPSLNNAEMTAGQGGLETLPYGMEPPFSLDERGAMGYHKKEETVKRRTYP